MSLATLALRNVSANKRRSLFVVCLIGISVCALLVMDAFVSRVYWGVRESVVRSQTGHLQVMSKHYDTLRGVDSNQLLFANSDALLSKLGAIPGVVEATRRVEFKGLIGYKGQSMVFGGVGVEPRADNVISSFDRVIDGRGLVSADQWKAAIGQGMGQGLGAVPGDSLIVTTVMPQGGLNAADFEVSGITQSDSSDYDQHMLKVPLATAQRLLNTKGVSKLVLLLDATDATADVKRQVQAVLERDAPDLIVKDWRELNPQYDKIVALYSRIFGFVAGALVLLSTLSIGNVMSMSFLERIREFSVMRAIGLRKPSLVTLLLTEGSSLALLACVAGVALALGLSWVMAATGGIPMPPPPGSNRGFPLVLQISPISIGVLLCGSVLVGVLSCVLVAWRAIRLQPAMGLRHA
jgi:putative ABC transport system permease protein